MHELFPLGQMKNMIFPYVAKASLASQTHLRESSHAGKMCWLADERVGVPSMFASIRGGVVPKKYNRVSAFF